MRTPEPPNRAGADGSEIDRRIGFALAAARERKSVLPEELAEQLKVRTSWIREYEAGLARPSPDLLLRWTDLLEISLEQLFRAAT